MSRREPQLWLGDRLDTEADERGGSVAACSPTPYSPGPENRAERFIGTIDGGQVH